MFYVGLPNVKKEISADAAQYGGSLLWDLIGSEPGLSTDQKAILHEIHGVFCAAINGTVGRDAKVTQ